MIYFDKDDPGQIPTILPGVAVCPICDAPLVIEDIDEWEEETGRVTDGGFHINCSTEPDIDDEEWNDWFDRHWSTPYIDWLPVEQLVYRWFDKRYRLKLGAEHVF